MSPRSFRVLRAVRALESGLGLVLMRRASASTFRHVERTEGTVLDRFGVLPDGRALSRIEISLGAYERGPSEAERIAWLRDLSTRLSAEGEIMLTTTVSDEYGQLARLALGPLRTVARAVGLPLAEPLDRVGPDGLRFVHFFSERDLAIEARAAGLDIVARQGAQFVLRPRGAMPRDLPGAPNARHLVSLVPAFVWAERMLARATPKELFARARERGHQASSVRDREAHRVAIAWADGILPGSRGCYRRTAVELATCREAAKEAVLLGLDVGKTGHAWLESDPRARAYDVHFRLEADA